MTLKPIKYIQKSKEKKLKIKRIKTISKNYNIYQIRINE